MSTFLGRRWAWRDWALVVLTMTILVVLAATLTAAVVDSISARRGTEHILLDQRAASTRRIDLLQKRIEALQQQVTAQAIDVGLARQSITDLEAQVRQLGGQPVTTRRTAP